MKKDEITTGAAAKDEKSGKTRYTSSKTATSALSATKLPPVIVDIQKG